MIRQLLARLFSKSLVPLRRRRCPLDFDALEQRWVPAQYLWTYSGGGAGAFETAANWTNLVSPFDHTVPGSGDYAIFDPSASAGGTSGSNAACTLGADLTVDRIVMDSDYSGTFTLSTNADLDLNNQFVQYGTLTMSATSTIDADSIYINGTLGMTATGTALVDAAGSFFLNGGISVSGMGPGGPVLGIESSGFDDGGAITVGSSLGGYGTLTITGPYVQSSGGTATVHGAGLLNFLTGGTDFPIMEGTISLTGSLTTDMHLALDGGDLTSYGAGADITGDVAVYNSGVLNVGTVSAGSTLTHLAGSLTVGSTEPEAAPTGGTLNLYSGSVLSIPAAANDSTFVVTSMGVINMYGAAITMNPTRVDYLELHHNYEDEEEYDPGTINTHGSSSVPPAGDVITGHVLNAGLIHYAGSSLHSLTIAVMFGVGGGDYTQTEDGELAMRLDNSEAEDVLLVGDDSDLAGTLTLTQFDDALADEQSWGIIVTNDVVVDDFDAVNWPDGDPDWLGVPGAVYAVLND